MNEDALTRTQRIDAYVAANAKSLKVAMILAFLFGPLGLLYASGAYGGIMIAVVMVSAMALPPLATLIGILAWLASMAVAYHAVGQQHEALRAQALLLIRD